MGRPKSLHKSVPGLWRIFRHFWPWIRKQRQLIAGASVALFASVILRLLEPWPLKFIFDSVFPVGGRPGGPRVPVLGALDPLTVLTVSVFGLVAIVGLRALLDYYNAVGFARIGNRVLRDIRNHVYRHLHGLSLAFHHQARSGDLIVRVTRDVSMLRDVTATAVLPLLANLLILVGMVVVMLWMQWRLALLAMAIVPLFWFTTVRIGRGIQEASRKQRRREGAMAATAAESISAIRLVQALSLEEVFAQDFSSRNNQSQKEDMKAARLSARLGRTVDVLLAIATALVLWYGARLVLRAELTPGDLLVFLTYLKRSFHPAKDFAKYTGRLAKATAAGERVLDLLERTPEVRDLPHAQPAPPFEGAVRFAEVSFGYTPEDRVLRQVEFEVSAGLRVALVGRSGIGKSTVASLLLRLYDPQEGQVMIDGRDIRDFTLASLRSQMSVVMQDSILFAASVWDNIGYGAPGATRAEIEAAARLANAHEFIQALPQGYDTVLGERGVTLSHGQRQRIAIARAAVRRSPLLILDEPTTGLDEENERAVIEALHRLTTGRTTFLITHNLQHAASADQILYLEHGCITECGSHDELMRLGGRYASLFRLQTSSSGDADRKETHVLTR
jgi:ATP-binding cassette, subfamily B, bacterial